MTWALLGSKATPFRIEPEDSTTRRRRSSAVLATHC